LNDDSGFSSHLTGLQVASYLRAMNSGVMAEFPASRYEEVSNVYQIILDIKRLIDNGYRISGRVSPGSEKEFYLKGIDNKGFGYYLAGIEKLPQKLSDLEENFK